MNLCSKSFRHSNVFIYFGLLIFLLQSQIIHCQLLDYFDKNLCRVRCEGRNHTLCKALPIPICDEHKVFNIFEVHTLHNGETLKLLVDGHNELRNRIACKEQIGNMVKINWDEDLVKMAVEYFKQCKLGVDDPCTTFFANVRKGSETLEYKLNDASNHRFIAQNRFRLESECFPKNIITSALRSWYHEKAQPHLYHSRMLPILQIGYISNENNFTHMAYPLASKFGCAIAQIDKYYELVCNYYPFYRHSTSLMLYASAKPASVCPIVFPIRDPYFENLCGDGNELGMSSALKVMPAISYYILLAIAKFMWILM